MFSSDYNTLVDLIREFPTDEACRKHLEHVRWGDDEGNINPVCPHCGSTEKMYRIESGKRYKCASCRLSTFELGEGERFDLSLAGLEGSLTYDQLVGSPEWP